jgi:ATP diphosphatase
MWSRGSATTSWSSTLSSIPPLKPSRDISRLLEIMAALRNPDGGCPWDLEQDFESIRHYTIEEAYEVADAIERKDFNDLREELGDLLLQPVFHAQMAVEAGLFDFGDVVQAITEKLIRRHPHVFGEQAARDAGGAKARWDDVKDDERARKAAARGTAETSILDDVAHTLPALSRAEKLTKRAAKVGFDWPGWKETIGKVREELDEVEETMNLSHEKSRVAEEIGDLLFAAVNLARQLDVDPEAALRDANVKFTRRFHYVEDRAKQDNVRLAEAGLERLDGYWNEIRAADKANA